MSSCTHWPVCSNTTSGDAEEVSDPALTREPLAHPGVVIKRSRGTTTEQIAALPKDAPSKPTARSGKKAPKAPAAESKPKRRAPKPSRDALDAAKAALAEAERQQEVERDELTKRERELARERDRVERRQQRALAELPSTLHKARRAYERAIKAWDG